jgi:uncharacterized protein YacL
MAKDKEDSSVMSAAKLPSLPRRFTILLAEEIAKIMVVRMPTLLPKPRNKKITKKKSKKIENAIFLDTSAIIDARIFDLISLGLMNGTFVVTDSILRELKYIADSQDSVRRERGRQGLDKLNRIRKTRGVKLIIMREEYINNSGKPGEIDERIIKAAKTQKGKIITCDYNLNKKANIDGVSAVNINELAHILKIAAVPGEALHIKILHVGKEEAQGVGYLDDGTMIVVDQGRENIGQMIDVVVSRVIQTASGRILFAKKI